MICMSLGNKDYSIVIVIVIVFHINRVYVRCRLQCNMIKNYSENLCVS